LFSLGKRDSLFIVDVIIFSFNAVAPLLFPIALGWFIRQRRHIAEGDMNFLNRLCFRYLLPFHIFNNTRAVDIRVEFNPRLILVVSLCIFLVMLFSWIIFALTIRNRERRCIMIVSSFRSNNLIYALPLAANLFGAEGITVASMMIPVVIILFNFFCVVVMVCYAPVEEGETELKETLKRTALDILRNPLIIGSVGGIVFSLLGIALPGFLQNGINGVAASATPIALMLLGAQIDFKALAGNLGPALGACALRLVIVPGILVPLMILLGFRGPELGALMVAFAAPCAVNNLIMARNYRIDPPFAAQTVYLSTVLSLPTMFVAISLLRALGLF
jgi:predicted permease